METATFDKLLAVGGCGVEVLLIKKSATGMGDSNRRSKLKYDLPRDLRQRIS
jgi:hypothetical protein